MYYTSRIVAHNNTRFNQYISTVKVVVLKSKEQTNKQKKHVFAFISSVSFVVVFFFSTVSVMCPQLWQTKFSNVIYISP